VIKGNDIHKFPPFDKQMREICQKNVIFLSADVVISNIFRTFATAFQSPLGSLQIPSEGILME
jgi:hypothetical protein